MARAAAAAGAVTLARAGSRWSHNNSVMIIKHEGEVVSFVYEKPRVALEPLGIEQGTTLFEGRRTGESAFAGEAVTFSRRCGPAKFSVAGELSEDGSTVVLIGQKPQRGANCAIRGYRSETLRFDLAAE